MQIYFRILAQHKEVLFLLNTITHSDRGMYIFPPGKMNRQGKILKDIYQQTHQIFPFNDIPTAENLPIQNPKKIKYTTHDYKQLNTKNSDETYRNRGYTDLMNPNGITDFYMFIPKDPTEYRMKSKYEKK